ncbi:MAG: hypothetical protein HRT44_13600, partial [Bdellovibrionales bacterium]|nr:hypothetical protein [Bdellovibrionales bacterium]NQZ20273.1 hypothetical protein [Bdellovibrionales bacterium]
SDPDNFQKVQTLRFPLDDEFTPTIDNGELLLDVEIFFDPDFFFPTHYQVRNPRIINPNQGVRIKGMRIFLNGDNFLVTTFEGLDIEINSGTTEQELDPGSADAVFLKDDEIDIYDNTDEWSITFDSIETF